MTTVKFFTHENIFEAAKEALENWAWEVYEENGESAERVEARKEALRMDMDYIEENWPDGLELKPNEDIFDFLEEFTTNMS